MKKYFGLFLLFPLYIFAMGEHYEFFQLPIIHRAEDYLPARKYSFATIDTWSIEDLSVKREMLCRDSDFQKELPLIINEANAFKELLEDNACAQKSCVYGKCVSKIGAGACLGGYVANLTHNFDLGLWITAGILARACYQWDTELKNNSRVRIDLQRKIALLEGIKLDASIEQTQQRLAALQQAIADRDPYDFSYGEER